MNTLPSALLNNPFFSISTVNDVQSIRFHDNDFRRFLNLNFRMLVGLCYGDNDTASEKKEKDRTQYPLNDLLQVFVSFIISRYSFQLKDYSLQETKKVLLNKSYDNVFEDEINSGDTSNEDLLKYNHLHQQHIAAVVDLILYSAHIGYQSLLAYIDKFNKNEPMSANQLLAVLKDFYRSDTLLLVDVDGKNSIITEVTDVRIVESFGGSSFQFLYPVCIHNGNSFVVKNARYSIPVWEKDMRPSEIGISVPSQDDIDSITLRADKYIDTVKDGPKYLFYTGRMEYKQGWMTRRFNATGRVVIDYSGMKESCPNYYSFFPFGDASDDDSSSSGCENPDKKLKLRMSPYLYGFSLKCKNWGQFNVSDLSEIAFREDAYEKLVLENETKDLIRALVDSGLSAGPDLIDSKGGGCIFLLEGPPGVGKQVTL